MVQRKDSLRPRKVMRGLTIDSSQLGKTLSNVFTHTCAKIFSLTSVQIFLRQQSHICLGLRLTGLSPDDIDDLDFKIPEVDLDVPDIDIGAEEY